MAIFGFIVVLSMTSIASGSYYSGRVARNSLKLQSSIQELRSEITPLVPESSAIRDFVKDDLFLVKWLESYSMDVSATREGFRQHLEWRQKEEIDQLDSMDWTNFEEDFRIFTGKHDKQGQPIAEMWLSEWDVRRALVSGLRRRLTQWLAKMIETEQRQLYETRRSGRNVTHSVLLIDLDGYNSVTLGCPECLRLYAYWGLDFERNFPNLFEDVILVNGTPVFNVVLSTLRKILNSKTMDTFESYTKEKRVWLKRLDSIIDRNERSGRFGGNLNEDYDNDA